MSCCVRSSLTQLLDDDVAEFLGARGTSATASDMKGGIGTDMASRQLTSRGTQSVRQPWVRHLDEQFERRLLPLFARTQEDRDRSNPPRGQFLLSLDRWTGPRRYSSEKQYESRSIFGPGSATRFAELLAPERIDKLLREVDAAHERAEAASRACRQLGRRGYYGARRAATALRIRW